MLWQVGNAVLKGPSKSCANVLSCADSSGSLAKYLSLGWSFPVVQVCCDPETRAFPPPCPISLVLVLCLICFSMPDC